MGRDGGLRDRLPDHAGSPRLGTGRRLSFTDRKSSEAGVRAGRSFRAIAADLGRAVSTVSREAVRGRGSDGIYYAAVGHARAHTARHQPKPSKQTQQPAKSQHNEDSMDQGWSPHLIATMLREQGDPL